MYNPRLAVWTEAEPNGAQYVDGLNLYDFEGNSPINHLDPTGMQATATAPVTHVEKLRDKVLVKEITEAKIVGNIIEYKYDYEIYNVDATCDAEKPLHLDKMELVPNMNQGKDLGIRHGTLVVGKPNGVTTNEQALEYVKAKIWPALPAWYENYVAIKQKVFIATGITEYGPHEEDKKYVPPSTQPTTTTAPATSR